MDIQTSPPQAPIQNTQTPAPVAQSTPDPIHGPRKGKGVIVGAVIVGVLAVGYLAYAYLTESGPFAPTEPMASESPSPSVGASPTSDTMAGWKTYTNTQYGFSFQYPSDWNVSLDGNTVFIDNGIENTSNIEPDPRWLQMQVLLPPDGTKSVTDGYEHRYYGPIEGWELVSNEFGSDSLSVILKLSADSYFSVGVYGAFVQQRAAVDSLFSTFTK